MFALWFARSKFDCGLTRHAADGADGIEGAAAAEALGVREQVQTESSDRDGRVIDRVAAAAKLLEIKDASRSGVSLRKMVSILIHGFGVVPVCEGQINKGARLMRARLNPTEVPYNCEKDLSYRPDDWAVPNYGRASVPLRSVFYGVLGNESREATVETVLSEAHEIFRNTESASDIVPHEFYCTFGVWRVTEPINIAEMVFSKRFVRNVEWVKTACVHYLDSYASKLKHERVDTVRLLLEFVSDEFSRSDIRTHEDYLVSAAYSQYVFESTPLRGVLYPSVRTKGYGVNVALSPSTVDRFTTLEEAHFSRVATTDRQELLITPLKTVTDFGPLNPIVA